MDEVSCNRIGWNDTESDTIIENERFTVGVALGKQSYRTEQNASRVTVSARKLSQLFSNMSSCLHIKLGYFRHVNYSMAKERCSNAYRTVVQHDSFSN